MTSLSEQFYYEMDRACRVLEEFDRGTQTFLSLCRQTEWEELHDALSK